MQGALLTGTAALAAFLLGWGGLSVHCQSLLFVLETDLSCKPYFVGKFLQGLFFRRVGFCIVHRFPLPDKAERSTAFSVLPLCLIFLRIAPVDINSCFPVHISFFLRVYAPALHRSISQRLPPVVNPASVTACSAVNYSV